MGEGKRAILLLLLLLTAAACFGEEEPLPEEYAPEEFSPFLQDLRRAEIIFFGSLPLSLFLCFEAYDITRYFHVRSEEGAEEAAYYAPWPIKRYGDKPYSATESKRLLLAALSLSLTAALADFMIGRIRERRSARPAD